jgi:hypothetical protein
MGGGGTPAAGGGAALLAGSSEGWEASAEKRAQGARLRRFAANLDYVDLSMVRIPGLAFAE